MGGDDDYSYEIDPMVEQVNGFSRLSGSNTFDAEDDEYWMGVAGFAILAMAIGVGQALIFVLWMCCRCVMSVLRCCCSCCCKKKNKTGDPHAVLASKGSMIFWRRLLFTMLFLTIIVGLGGLAGDTQVSDGMGSIGDAVGIMGDKMGELSDIAADFSSQASGMSAELTTIETECEESTGTEIDVSDLTSVLDDMADTADDFSEMIGDIPEILDDAADNVDDADGYRQMATAVPIVLMWVVAILGTLGTCCSSPIALRMTCFVGIVTIIASSAALAVELCLSVVLSDICVDPDQVIIDGVDNSAQDTLEYYLQCKGDNPIGDILDDLTDQTDEIRDLSDDYSGCGDDAFDEFLDILDESVDSLDQLNDLLSCSLLADPWRVGMHQGVCQEIVPGLVTLWAVTAVCGELLMISMFVAAITWKRIKNASAEEKAQKMFRMPTGIPIVPSK